MIHLSIPGFGEYRLEDLVVDYNGTLAIDGRIIGHVADNISVLAKSLRIHVLTADTFGLLTLRSQRPQYLSEQSRMVSGVGS